MSYLDKLLEGVEIEWKRFEEIGIVSGAGVDKTTNDDEKAIKLLNYMDVYRNRHLTNDIPSMTVTASINKIEQCNVLKGDIFFTPSSEVLNDIGNSAVALEDLDGVVYSYHIMRLRLTDPNLTTSFFISYMLGSDVVQKQINKKAKGITRFGLTKTQWEILEIPIPPLKVQKEIVCILDTFTELTTELVAELAARKKQYDYYREKLLHFDEREVEWKTLGKIGEIRRGMAITEKETNIGDYPVVANGPSHNYYHDQSNRRGETIVIARSGAYAGLVSYWNIPIFLTDAFSIHPDNNFLSTKFLYYVLKKDQTKIHNMGKGAGVPHVRAKDFESYKVPVPSLEEQARIVSILDKFDILTTSISEGLPKEIELRKKQYEYYRDMLLTFPKDNLIA